MTGENMMQWPRFTIRGLFVATLLAGLACGWYSAVVRERTRSQQAASIDAGDSAFQRASFSDCQLRGAVLLGDTATFQIARFDRAVLANSSLIGQGASFQAATFSGANLSGAKIAGTHSSFQLASFAQANLSGAQLDCSDTAFQATDFSGANLRGATLASRGQSLQGLNIDAAQFQGADLRQISSESLAGWEFTVPPVYDDQTKFPSSFDPVVNRWSKATQ